MKTEIMVMVREDRAVVRKVERNDKGIVVAKYGLSEAGQWVRVRAGERYPEECRLPVLIYEES